MDATSLWCPVGTEPRLHWGGILGHVYGLGGPEPGQSVLLAIRGIKLGENETHETIAVPDYDDLGILFSGDATTGHEPFVFPMSTHSYQADSKLSPDIDGDGRGDVATIRPGHYVLTLAITKPHPIWVMTTVAGSGSIPCFRDVSHDRHYQPDEIARESHATAVLLHSGFDAPPEAAHHSSIACQCAPIRSLQVLATAGKVLQYRLVTAAEAIEAAKASARVADTIPPPENVA